MAKAFATLESLSLRAKLLCAGVSRMRNSQVARALAGDSAWASSQAWLNPRLCSLGVDSGIGKTQSAASRAGSTQGALRISNAMPRAQAGCA